MVPVTQIPAEVAEKLSARWVRQNNTRLKITPPSELEIRSNRENCLHIYNVGPWSGLVRKGDIGDFYIPPCPSGEKFVRGPVIPGTFYWHVPGENRMERLADPGTHVANEILGIGIMLRPQERLTNWGIFVGKQLGPDARPLENELAAARGALRDKMLELFVEANSAWALGPREFDQVKSKDHIMAAKWLNRTDVQWMRSMEPTEAVKCKICATGNSPEAIICANCKEPLDIEKWAAYEANKERLREMALAKVKASK